MMESVIVAGKSIGKNKLVKDNELYEIYTDESEEIVQSITLLKANQMTTGHKHRHWETYNFEEGGLTLFLNGLGHEIKGPCVKEIPPNVHHRVRNNTDKKIGFRCTWLKSDVKVKA